MATFALKENLASEKHGKDIWFRFWTVIGPCCTSKEEERALFRSRPEAMNCSAYTHPLIFFRPEAMNCSAYTHPLSFFEPVYLEDGAAGDFDWNTVATVQKRKRRKAA